MDTLIKLIAAGLFILFSYLFFNPINWWNSWRACKEEGHLLRINFNGVRVPRHKLTHCVRCSTYLGTEEELPDIKIKGWEDYSHQYNNF